MVFMIKSVIIINDCRDANAVARQTARISAFINCYPTFVGVTDDLEAAGNLVDALDATSQQPALILVNVAPRNGQAKKWSNGSPFAYFRFKNALVVTTIGGLVLSLVKKLKITDSVNLLDTRVVVDEMIAKGEVSPSDREDIINTQFRSYDFIPRIAKYLLLNKDAKSTAVSISEIPDADGRIWWIDSFGNCKTTILPTDIDFGLGKIVKTKIGKMFCYPRLKDVPDGKAALVVGSSGISSNRFLELVVQGRNSSSRFKLRVGDKIL